MQTAPFCWPAAAHPRVFSAGRIPFSPETAGGQIYRHRTIALHQHYYHGRMLVENGQTLLIRPGDVTWSLANVETRYELEEPGYHWCIHFYPAAARSRALEMPLHLPFGMAGSYVSERMRAIADLFARAQESPAEPLLQEAVSLSLRELIWWLALNPPRLRGSALGLKSGSAVAEARRLLDECFNKPLSAKCLTEAVGLSRNYLAARFQEQCGMTMDLYLLRRRIEAARHLLLTTRLPVKEVAFQVGIPDPQYFNKQFRRVAGVSPANFRALEE